MMTPTVHLNGTSRLELREAHEAAWNKLTDALVALQGCSPNGRDYYPQGAYAIEVALGEHRTRILAVMQVKTEITELLASLV
jgi:hypothetical protein